MITWKVLNLNTKSDKTYTDIVTTVAWSCVLRDDKLTESQFGACNLPAPTDLFTQYADLTEQQVLDWCWTNGVDKAATEALVQRRMTRRMQPPPAPRPLPWAE